MVEPAAGDADDEQAPRLERGCGVERELEVGRVLLGRMAFDSRAGGLGRREPAAA